MDSNQSSLEFKSPQLLGKASIGDSRPLLDGGQCYVGSEIGDGIAYSFSAGTLAQYNWLTCDLLLSGNTLAVFEMALVDEDSGARFSFVFSLLSECGARLRMPMEATAQNRWLYEREGALLKPMCFGDRVDPGKVTRIEIKLHRKGPDPVYWQQTPLIAASDEPALLNDPVLPQGILIDQYGQSFLRHWPGKTAIESQLVKRLFQQLSDSSKQTFPKGFSRFGGDASKQVAATGFFHTHNDGSRWWLVDPDGFLFWSAGVDCVQPEISAKIEGIEKALKWTAGDIGEEIYEAARSGGHFNYLICNLIRAFGKTWYEDWTKIALGQLRSWGFNTIANWSDIEIAKKAAFPYVRPLDFRPTKTQMLYRDFPDVFSDDFIEDAKLYAKQLESTALDPALIGYFLMNEPTWGFSSEPPALGLLFNSGKSVTRTRLSQFLQAKYRSDSAFSAAWDAQGCTFESIENEKWTDPVSAKALADLEKFSSIMVDRYFGVLSDACREVDPNHLNLGARYYTVPPAWALAGMCHFDIFSVNCYDEVVNSALEDVSKKLNMPVMIGEWHFGALDVGLPGTGIGHVKDQKERGKAFRRYTEDAAAKPWCVGTHYFTLYDQSCIGRFDGENYNIGLIDTCNRPYEELTDAATIANTNVYAIAPGQKPPFNEPVEYLPKLYM
jgi:hypothetical protein